MNNEMSALIFRHDSRAILLREDFLDICEGNGCAAMVLSQMYHWHRMEAASPYPEFWILKAHGEMQKELLAHFGEKAIPLAFALLVAKGYLDARANPYDRRDRRSQYKFCVKNVQAAMDALPPIVYVARTPQPMPAPCKAVDGYVYLLRSSHGLYKIGKSIMPVDRVRNLGVVLPFPIQTECLIPCDHYTWAESFLHKKMEQYRVNSEWFDLPQQEVDWIMSLESLSDGIFTKRAIPLES